MEGINSNIKIYGNQESIQKEGTNLFGLLQGDPVEVALYTLYNDEYSLKESRCIPMTLRYDNLSYIFIQQYLNLWGEEKSLQEAEEAIASAIVKLYKRLSELDRKNKLGPFPAEQLAYLKQYID
jgi:hypothetical protein